MLSRVGYIELGVPDLDGSIEHAVDLLGMRGVEEVAGSHYLTCNSRHHELVLRQSAEPNLCCVGLEAASLEAFVELRERIGKSGAEVIDGATLAVEQSFRCVAPGGLLFEIFVGMEGGQPSTYDSIAVQPRKFGHATLKSGEPRKLERFICDVLGFRLSDRVPGVLSWFRCSADHHGLAIVDAQEDGLHHYAFELEGWSSVESFTDHLSNHDTELIWGPGRHGPGRNIFTYHLDPAGAVLEVFTDLQLIESEAGFEPLEWESSARTLNQWGPAPPPEFFDYCMPQADVANALT